VDAPLELPNTRTTKQLPIKKGWPNSQPSIITKERSINSQSLRTEAYYLGFGSFWDRNTQLFLIVHPLGFAYPNCPYRCNRLSLASNLLKLVLPCLNLF
jgi:hypothetical protein